MQTRITGRHLRVYDSVRTHALNRVEKLGKFYNGIVDAHVVLDLAPSTQRLAEISLNVYRQKLTAQASASTHQEAIDTCAENLRRQLMRYKEKRRSKERRERLKN